jgi:hypothetical protein
MNNKEYPWPTVRIQGLSQATGLSKDYIDKGLKKRLQEGIYHHRIPGSNRVLYNLNLIRDWLAQGDCEAHQRAVEKYLSSLPSSTANAA